MKTVWTKFTVAYLWDAIPYPAVSPRFLAFQHSEKDGKNVATTVGVK